MSNLSVSRAVGAAGLWLLCGAAAAGPTTPECRRALDELQRREARLPPRAASAPGTSIDPRLRELRTRTASICLGEPDATPAPAARAGERARSGARTAEGPVRVAPISPPPSARSAAPEPLPPLPVPKAAPPTVVLGCDAAGCWSSDGTRLQRMGPNLVGPGGQCVLGGNIVQCP